jgi:hypothetical protein
MQAIARHFCKLALQMRMDDAPSASRETKERNAAQASRGVANCSASKAVLGKAKGFA